MFKALKAISHYKKAFFSSTKYLLELKESLLIIRDRPSMNWNICPAPSLYV